MAKLPSVKSLQTEYAELLKTKKAAYADYRKAREEMRELATAKANVERILGKPPEREARAAGKSEQRFRRNRAAVPKVRWGPRASPVKRVAWGEEAQRSALAFGTSRKRGIRSLRRRRGAWGTSPTSKLLIPHGGRNRRFLQSGSRFALLAGFTPKTLSVRLLFHLRRVILPLFLRNFQR